MEVAPLLKLEVNVYLPALLYVAVLIISIISEVFIRKFISNKFEKTVVDVTLLVLFSLILFFLGWNLSESLTKWNYRELFKDTAVLISSLYMVRAAHILSQRKVIKYIPYLTFLIAYVLSLIYVFSPNLSDFYLTLILKLRKLFVSLGVIIIFLEFCSAVKSEKNRRILRISGLFTLITIFTMWILNYLTFSSQTIVGVAIALILTSLLILVYSKLIPKVSEFLQNKLSDRDVEVVESNLKLLSFMIYIILFIKSLSNFSNLYKVINKLYVIYIIKTDLIKISLGNILNVLILGLILFSLLNVGKKLIKLTFPQERREVEGGSAEALIFNLGVLFNLIILLSVLGITLSLIHI
jgi:potassium efflux system protein